MGITVGPAKSPPANQQRRDEYRKAFLGRPAFRRRERNVEVRVPRPDENGNYVVDEHGRPTEWDTLKVDFLEPKLQVADELFALAKEGADTGRFTQGNLRAIIECTVIPHDEVPNNDTRIFEDGDEEQLREWGTKGWIRELGDKAWAFIVELRKGKAPSPSSSSASQS